LKDPLLAPKEHPTIPFASLSTILLNAQVPPNPFNIPKLIFGGGEKSGLGHERGYG